MSISANLIELTTKLMLARERSEIIQIASALNGIAAQIIILEEAGFNSTPSIHQSETTDLKFTEQEITKMSPAFKKIFVANGLVAHVTKRPSGKSKVCYTIRYRRDGYNIVASGADLSATKEKFLAMTKPENIGKYYKPSGIKQKDVLENVFEEFYHYKEGLIERGLIAPKTLKSYRAIFYQLPEDFRKKSIKDVRTSDIDDYIRGLDKPRAREDVRSIFSMLFKYAIASGIVAHNPVTLVPFIRAERENRDSLSREEISTFLKTIKEPKYDRIRQGAYLMYFFGLRPCEIDEDTRKEGEFLIARNRKRKKGKIEYKKIPIPKEANNFIDWDKPLTFQLSDKPRERLMAKIVEGKTAYNLRHTFSSICQENVKQEIVNIWIGDSPELLIGKVYTHFSDDFMRAQMNMVCFPVE